ncbi:FxSxx-COOH system tetratricopeptide repeat protein [Actinocrispum wychmicini]|uniref:Cellulose biosynthesis protein BcsQ n=1 Tax=Actinocrispum wychmicini TaxID=1213861 RepID=A0A4R2J7B9_9PSEU|nr:FxSxx-COOH system tetratricopeptide repeat protein [Actinocrispum wychmicini]TCO53512.1 cellulose biosynthesis protein BcsQ [Actinocrispum wychmicini]
MSNPSGGAARSAVVAFLSAAGGAGRTSAVANLAWALASAGRRVLVVDLGSEQPHVPDYLAPFYVGEAELAERTRRAVLAVLSPPHVEPVSTVERYSLPRAAGHIDVLAPRVPAGGGRLYLDVVEASHGAISTLREQLATEQYDQVLIDAPTGTAGPVVALIAELADVAAVCFAPKGVNDAAALARQLKRQMPYRLDIVPVVTMFDMGGDVRAARSLANVRAKFGTLIDQSGAIVWIPYRSYEAYDPLLAVLFEDANDPSRVRAQYRRLAAAITKDDAIVIPDVSDEVRSRYRRIFGVDTFEPPVRVLVAYATEDRAWADWARAVLERGGAETRTLAAAGVGVAPAGGRLDTVASEWLDQPRPPELVVVRSSRLAPPDLPSLSPVWLVVERTEEGPPNDGEVVDLVDVHDAVARARLLTHFSLMAPRWEVDPVQWPRFPATRPQLVSLPPRNPQFVGRDHEIERLRDRMLSFGSGRAACTLTGPPGVGKSELALEYAYRFASDYDLIWWFSAHDRQTAVAGVAELGDRMHDPELTEDPVNEYGTTVPIEQLAEGKRFARWLLVYDNADDPAVLDGLMPDGGLGHVLVTSFNAADDTAITVPHMRPQDSAKLLTTRVNELSPADADLVADAVGHLPLALQLSVDWLVEAVEDERRVGSTGVDSATWATRAFLEQVSSEADDEPVVQVVRTLVESLKGGAPGRLAVLLAQMCAFLSPQGVALHLVRSPAMIDRLVARGGLDGAALRLDSWEIDRVLWTGTRFGLFRVDWGTHSSLRLHRLVQTRLRADMSTVEQANRRADVLAVLAAYAPIEVDEDASGRVRRFLELQKHVFVSGAMASRDDQVRRWLVNQLRFLYTDGGIGIAEAATRPAHQLLDSWLAHYGPADPLSARLGTQLANVERHLGRPTTALRLDDAALALQRRTLTRTHPQVLISARGRAGDLRGLGLFWEALDEDQATWEGFRTELGDDHPHTRSAANNLASSMYLAGDPAGALEIEEDNFARRTRMFGQDNPDTWWSCTRIGIYQRELGQYDRALTTLRTARDRLRQLRLDTNETLLRAMWHYAITERALAYHREAKDHTARVLTSLRELLGEHHPDTLACTLSYAMDHRAVGDSGVAVELSESVLAGLHGPAALPDDHPFIGLAQVCLGLSLCAAYEVEKAVGTVTAGLDVLRHRLGGTHRWTLAASVSQARVVAAAGDIERARDLVGLAYADHREYLGDDHPSTLIAASNLAVVRGPRAEFDQGWKDIDVDIPQT